MTRSTEIRRWSSELHSSSSPETRLTALVTLPSFCISSGFSPHQRDAAVAGAGIVSSSSSSVALAAAVKQGNGNSRALLIVVGIALKERHQAAQVGVRGDSISTRGRS